MISEMIKFDTAEQFYNWVSSGKDLYNVHLGHYVYLDSDDGRLGMAYVDNDDAIRYSREQRKTGDYWGESGEVTLYGMDMEQTMEYCKEHYAEPGWYESDEIPAMT